MIIKKMEDVLLRAGEVVVKTDDFVAGVEKVFA
jgi:hypothetical protein